MSAASPMTIQNTSGEMTLNENSSMFARTTTKVMMPIQRRSRSFFATLQIMRGHI